MWLLLLVAGLGGRRCETVHKLLKKKFTEGHVGHAWLDKAVRGHQVSQSPMLLSILSHCLDLSLPCSAALCPSNMLILTATNTLNVTHLTRIATSRWLLFVVVRMSIYEGYKAAEQGGLCSCQQAVFSQPSPKLTSQVSVCLSVCPPT